MSDYTYVLGRKVGAYLPEKGQAIRYEIGTVGSIQERRGLLPKLTVTLPDGAVKALLPENEDAGPYYVPLDIAREITLVPLV